MKKGAEIHLCLFSVFSIAVYGNLGYTVRIGGMTMLFLQYPPCSTCKKAKAWLDGRGVCYEIRHIKEENPTYEELKLWVEASGMPVKKFFNTSGLQYKALGLKDKLPQMSLEEQLRLLASDGMLVKRPLVVKSDVVLAGFKETEWEAALL